MKTFDPRFYKVLFVFLLFLAILLLVLSTNWASAAAAPRTARSSETVMTMKGSTSLVTSRKAEMNKAILIAATMYDEMDLGKSGLSRTAFEYAWIGYYKLRKRGRLHKTSVLSICDFSQSSSQERMYVIDLQNKRLVYHTFVAHGESSGGEYASSFSNRTGSNKSSMGFYVTNKTYHGNNGLSLTINGLDKGFNDRAFSRRIVIHGASYVSQRILHKYGVMGTTFGCPAIPEEMTTKIIPVLKGGSCFFIYYPSKKYLAESTVLNG